MLEAGGTIGGEFIDALRFTPRLSAPRSPLARELDREMRRRHVVGPAGLPHLPALTPVLAQLLREGGIQPLFLSAVTAVEPAADGFAVTALCMDDFRRFECRHFVDTTGDLRRLDAARALRSCTVNFLLLDGKVRSAGSRLPTGLSELPAAYESYRAFALEAKPDRPFHEHRNAVIELLRARPAALEGGQLLCIGSSLALSAAPVAAPRDGGGVFVPSCGSSDIMDALDRGHQWGERA